MSDPTFFWPYRGKFLGDCEYYDWYRIYYGETCGYFITRKDFRELFWRLSGTCFFLGGGR
jgi:hypothetical protein